MSEQRIAELEELNRRLSNMLVGSADRLQESVRQIKAEAWEGGASAGWGLDDEGKPNLGYRMHRAKLKNPYTEVS